MVIKIKYCFKVHTKKTKSWNEIFLSLQCLSSFCNSLCLSAVCVSACLEHHHQKLSQLNNLRRWKGDSGESSGGGELGRGDRNGRTFPSLISTPIDLNESKWSKCFSALILMGLWSNEWSGTLMITYYLEVEPMSCGRLPSSDKPGMLQVWCHFKTCRESKVSLNSCM